MSFQSYPIISFGSNIDLIRQGHNLLTGNIGDISGLQTLAKDSVVDAINGLQIAFSNLTLSAYPPLNNEQWITATTFTGPGTLNLFKLSSANELILGQTLIPFSALTDLGKVGTAFRAAHITTLNTTTIIAPTNLELRATSSHTFTLNASALVLSEVSATQLKLESTAEALDIKSTHTKIYSGTKFWDNDTNGNLVPGENATQDVGSTSNRVDTVYTKDVNASGTGAFTGALSCGSFTSGDGAAFPIGMGGLWFASLASIPANYLALNGQVVSQATYPALYALYGATYNTGGEGAGNFRLPNLTKYVPIGVDASQTSGPDISAVGKVAGTITHSHTVPQHYHSVAGINTNGGGNHAHGQDKFSVAVNSSGNAISFDHQHGYDHGHGWAALSIWDAGHSHGSSYTADAVGDHKHGNGSYAAASAGSHDHVLRYGESPGPISAVSGTQQTSRAYIDNDGDHTHDITGTSSDGGGHGHSVSGSSVPAAADMRATLTIATVGQTYGSANTSGVNGGTGTPNDHRHYITSSGNHEHNVAAHTAGTGGVNGDAQMTSGTAYGAPLFAVYYIVRAK